MTNEAYNENVTPTTKLQQKSEKIASLNPHTRFDASLSPIQPSPLSSSPPSLNLHNQSPVFVYSEANTPPRWTPTMTSRTSSPRHGHSNGSYSLWDDDREFSIRSKKLLKELSKASPSDAVKSQQLLKLYQSKASELLNMEETPARSLHSAFCAVSDDDSPDSSPSATPEKESVDDLRRRLQEEQMRRQIVEDDFRKLQIKNIEAEEQRREHERRMSVGSCISCASMRSLTPSESSEASDASFFVDKLQLAIMYSEPLVINENGRYRSLDILDFKREQDLLLDGLRKTGKAIRVRTYPATTDSLRFLLSSSCTMLHFSGHGMADNDDQDVLIFEDGAGCAHLVSEATLSSLLKPGHRYLRFVFVASCHSRRVGEAFLRGGVEHVICVQRDERVMDKSSITFARSFYHSLFTGNSIKAAFQIAQSRVAAEAGIPVSECDKFVLLSNPGAPHSPVVPHNESPDSSFSSTSSSAGSVFGFLPEGTVLDTTPIPRFHSLPSRQNFMGRNRDMHQVVSLVIKQRLVTIRGPPGIGKTSLAQAVSHYVVKREIFTEGVLFVLTRGCKTIEATYMSIYCAIRKDDLPEGVKRTGSSKEKRAVHHQKFVLDSLKRRNILLVLDNVEDPLNACPAAFRELIQSILEHCDNLTILLGSRQAIGGGVEHFPEKVYTLHPLEKIDAARLFKECSPRRITFEELGIGMSQASNASSQEVLEILAEHPVLNILGGHPQAIELACPLLLDRSMNELRSLLQTKSLDVLKVVGIPDDERSAVNTLYSSLSVSVDHLRKMNPEAIKFFSIMALLPAGARPQDLNGVWGTGWEELADMLCKCSLVVRRPVQIQSRVMDCFRTFPFVTDYCVRLFVQDSKFCDEFVDKFRGYFAEVCEAIFQLMGEGSIGAARAYEQLEFVELNFWACLRTWGHSQSEKQRRTQWTEPAASPVARLATVFSGILLLAGRHVDSLKVAERGLVITEKSVACDLLGEANLHKALGVLYTHTKDMNRAKRNLGQALVKYKGLSSSIGQAVALSALGFLHYKMSHYQDACNVYERALPHFERVGHRGGMLNCYKWLALLFKKVPNSLQKSYKYADLIKKRRYTIGTRQNSGLIHKWIGEDVSLHLQIPTTATDQDDLDSTFVRRQNYDRARRIGISAYGHTSYTPGKDVPSKFMKIHERISMDNSSSSHTGSPGQGTEEEKTPATPPPSSSKQIRSSPKKPSDRLIRTKSPSPTAQKQTYSSPQKLRTSRAKARHRTSSTVSTPAPPASPKLRSVLSCTAPDLGPLVDSSSCGDSEPDSGSDDSATTDLSSSSCSSAHVLRDEVQGTPYSIFPPKRTSSLPVRLQHRRKHPRRSGCGNGLAAATDNAHQNESGNSRNFGVDSAGSLNCAEVSRNHKFKRKESVQKPFYL